MPDLSLCLNTDCPSRLTCLRFTTTTDNEGWQAYGSYCPPAGHAWCDYYMRDTKTDVKPSKMKEP